MPSSDWNPPVRSTNPLATAISSASMAYCTRRVGSRLTRSAMVVARVNTAQIPSRRSTSSLLRAVLPGKLTLTPAKIRTIQRASSMTRSTPARRSRSSTVGRSGMVRAGGSAAARVAGLPVRGSAATPGVTLIAAHQSSSSRR